MAPLLSTDRARVDHATWQELHASLPDDWRCDALITDAPYSERTHAGHDDCVGDLDRRTISYAAWTPADVHAFVEAWHPRVTGWMVSITDHELALPWCDAFAATGRYVFSPLAFVAPGSRNRMSGDGPAQWSCWIIVARPRTREMAKWGTLPGAYVLPPGASEKMPVVGGKPSWLMRALVKDYTRENDLVLDPCCGGGTTLYSALREGRRAIGCDANEEHARLSADLCANPWAKNRKEAVTQPQLFGETP